MRITSDGDVVIGDTTASAALLLDVAGQIGATEYCDADGLNCFVATDVGGLFTDNTTHITRENFHILNAGLAAGSTTAGLDGDGTYSFYDPDKSALRGGAISGANDAWQDANIGLYSFAWGENVEASAYGSISMGDNSTSSANNAISLGSGNTSSGLSSVAIGEDTTASNSNAIAIGASVTASGASSFASGASTTAAGTSSFAMGQNNQANGDYSLAGGFFGTADGYASVSFGDANTADGYGSVALNVATTASGYASTALNDSTTASGNNAFSSGSSTTASGFNSIAFGREVRVGTGVAQTTDALPSKADPSSFQTILEPHVRRPSKARFVLMLAVLPLKCVMVQDHGMPTPHQAGRRLN